ncbi:MAG: hypothetical protein F2813_02140 [Actinobacteria bacterium]|nr:hypothetical protein [Actinomycetota bacterium]
MPGDRLPPVNRLEAWIVTGPLGHLLSAAADWAVLIWRLTRNRLSRKG